LPSPFFSGKKVKKQQGIMTSVVAHLTGKQFKLQGLNISVRIPMPIRELLKNQRTDIYSATRDILI
jgi:hypothetical protein